MVRTGRRDRGRTPLSRRHSLGAIGDGLVAVMARLCIKTEAWSIRQQIEANQIAFVDQVNFVAWFEWEYEWPALYADEGGQG